MEEEQQPLLIDVLPQRSQRDRRRPAPVTVVAAARATNYGTTTAQPRSPVSPVLSPSTQPRNNWETSTSLRAMSSTRAYLRTLVEGSSDGDNDDAGDDHKLGSAGSSDNDLSDDAETGRARTRSRRAMTSMEDEWERCVLLAATYVRDGCILG
jgi:hypothetical protein